MKTFRKVRLFYPVWIKVTEEECVQAGKRDGVKAKDEFRSTIFATII